MIRTRSRALGIWLWLCVGVCGGVVSHVYACSDDVNVVGEGEVVSPFLHAIENGTVSMVKSLIAACADVNRETDIIEGPGEYTPTTPLVRAVFVGRDDMVELLLECGAVVPPFVAEKEQSFVDLLKRADQLGNVKIVTLLLTTGDVDLHARDQKGRTILENVIHNGAFFRSCNPEIIKTMVLLGVLVDEKEKRRWAANVADVVERAFVEREQSMKDLGLFEHLLGNDLDKYLSSTTVEQILKDYGKKGPVNVYVCHEIKRNKRCAEVVELAKDTVQAMVLLPLGLILAVAELVCDFLYFGDTHPVLLARGERRVLAQEALEID